MQEECDIGADLSGSLLDCGIIGLETPQLGCANKRRRSI